MSTIIRRSLQRTSPLTRLLPVTATTASRSLTSSFTSSCSLLASSSSAALYTATPIRALHVSTTQFAAKVGDTRFSKSHEWARLTKADEVTVGITDYAQGALGDIVFIDFPEVGAKFEQGDSFGSVESVKATSSVYVPVAGTVTEINNKVKNDNAIVNSSPEKDGWLIKLKINKPQQLDTLLDKTKYDAHAAEEAKH